MTIKNAFYVVSDLARSLAPEKELTVDMFNRYAAMSQIEMAEDIYQKMKTIEGKGESTELRRDLLPFMGGVGGSLSGNGTRCTYSVPSDLWQVDRLLAAGKLVEMLTPAELNERIDNTITAPTSSLPIGAFIILSFYIYPDVSGDGDADLVYFKYLASGDEPQIVMENSNGVDVVDAGSSVDFALKSRYHSDIIMKILAYLNIPTTKENALSYIEAKQEP